MQKQIREIIGRVRRDYLEHVFVSVLFLWVLFIVYIIFGKPFSTYIILLYIGLVVLWEIKGESKFDIGDVFVSIIPILPAIMFYILL